MIRTENLYKRFPTEKGRPDVLAVDDLTLEVPAGEVFGFLGPNGAGKTTTVRMLAALIRPGGGRAWVNGLEVGREDMAIRRSVGLLTETPGLYERLSAEKNLAIFARLYEVADVAGQVEKYLRLLGLWERRRDPAGSFSRGMKQKLAIARALLHEPPLLFLDEPTGGLDPEAARLVRDFVAELRGQGRTIFLCTHNLAEADDLCDRIAIFKTKLVTVDTPARLRRQRHGRQVVFHLGTVNPGWIEMIETLPFVHEAQASDNKIVVRLDEPETQNPVIVRRLVEAGAEVQFVGELRRTLEDVYLTLIRNDG